MSRRRRWFPIVSMTILAATAVVVTVMFQSTFTGALATERSREPAPGGPMISEPAFRDRASSQECRVQYRIDPDALPGLSHSFRGQITVTPLSRPLGPPALKQWVMTFSFVDPWQSVGHGPVGTWSQSGTAVTVTPGRSGQVLPVDAPTTLVFDGSWGTGNPPPASFSLNGVACSVTTPDLVQVTGVVRGSSPDNCLRLVPDATESTRTPTPYLLTGADRALLTSGAHLLIHGYLAPGASGGCSGGTPLRVVSVQLAPALSSGSPAPFGTSTAPSTSRTAPTSGPPRAAAPLLAPSSPVGTIPPATPANPAVPPANPAVAPHAPTTVPGVPTVAPHAPTTVPHAPTTVPGVPTVAPHAPTTQPAPPPSSGTASATPAPSPGKPVPTAAPAVRPAPSVTLTAPISGATLAATAPLTLSADARIPGGSITRVEFYEVIPVVPQPSDEGQSTVTAVERLIGIDLVAPYAVVLPAGQLPAGGHRLTARAYDQRGPVATSDEVRVTVVTPQIGEVPVGEALVLGYGRMTASVAGWIRATAIRVSCRIPPSGIAGLAEVP